eukprot:g328.t1
MLVTQSSRVGANIDSGVAEMAKKNANFDLLKTKLSSTFTSAPILSDLQKTDFLSAIVSLRLHIENKGKSAVNSMLSVALDALELLLKKVNADKKMLAKVIEAKGQWLSLAAMSLGAENELTRARIIDLVELAKKAKDEKDFAPYVLALRLCVDRATDVLPLCKDLKDDLVNTVRNAKKKSDVVQLFAIDSLRILVGFIDEKMLSKKDVDFIFEQLKNPLSFVYAPLRHKHAGNETLLAAAESLIGISKIVIRDHAKSVSLLSYDANTMCVENNSTLNIEGDNSNSKSDAGVNASSVKKKTGDKKKKTLPKNLTPAMLKKLMKDAQKNKSKKKTISAGASTRKPSSSKDTSGAPKSKPSNSGGAGGAKTGMTNLKKIGKEDHPLLSSIIALLLESNESVSKYASSLLASISSKGSGIELLKGLVTSYRRNLFRQGRQLTAKRKKLGDKLDDQMPNVYAKNMQTLNMLAKSYNSINVAEHNNEVVASMLFCSHHPSLSKGQKKSYKIWTEIQNICMGHEINNRFFAYKGLSDLLCKSDKHGIFSTFDMERAASKRVLSTMTKFGDEETLTFVNKKIIPLICEKLNCTNNIFINLTPKSIGIYNTPKGQVYEKDSLNSGQDNTKKNSKGTEDQRWEEQVRLELERKKKAEEAAKRAKAGKLDPEFEKKLKEEEDVRDGINTHVNTTLYGLETIITMTKGNKDFAYENLRALLSASQVFLDFKTSLEKVYNLTVTTMEDIAQCTEDPVGDELFKQVTSLYYVATRCKTISGEDDSMDLAQIIVNTIYDKWNAAPENMKIFFSSGTLEFLLPIFSHVVKSKNVSGKLRSKAFALLSAHILLDNLNPEFRLMIMKSTLHLLNVAQGMSPSPIDTLKVLCCSGKGVFTKEEFEYICGDDGLLSLQAHVRKGALTAIVGLNDNTEFNSNPKYLFRLWLSQFDCDKDNLEFAEDTWGDLFGDDDEGVLPSTGFDDHFATLMCHKERLVQRMAADALSGAMGVHSDDIESILQKLLDLYRSKAPMSEEDKMEKKKNSAKPKFAEARSKKKEIDPNIAIFAGTRGAVGRVFGAAGDEEVFSLDNVENAFGFLIETGLRDVDSYVRQEMTNSGMRLVSQYGKDAADKFLHIFEIALGNAEAAEKNKKLTEAEYLLYDHQREGVIVFMGTIAKYMDPQNPKIPKIIETLIQALRTPSEDVQLAVAGCLPAIMKLEKKRVGNDGGKHIIETLLNRVLNEETYGERRGASHGLAASVKGLGIPVLTTFSVIPKLKEAAGNRKKFEHRQGALFCFERLCMSLGLLFEPFVIQLLESMLILVSDRHPQVSEAARDATRAVMTKLSAHGVKLVMEPLLKALEAPKWQSKVASISMLGSMSYCAPKQLASCLPKIMPKLNIALADAHPRVRKAGLAALDDVSSVITNPEISNIASKLRDAMADPPQFTEVTLKELEEIEFVNPVDAPALAMIMPVVLRGISDRSTKSKSAAARIVGGMCNMVNEAKTLMPYKIELLDALKKALADPIPNVRALAAQGLGEMVRGMGETEFPDLVTYLIETTKSDTTTVERSGGAQGLSEVMVALGPERLESTLLNELLPCQHSGEAYVREGIMWILAFLPPIMGGHFAEILEHALPVVLKSLSDEAEFVRNVSLKAGQIIVTQHAVSHTDLLLPLIENAMFDADWRIRQSAVQLLGDLLFQIAGIKRQGADKYGNSNAEVSKGGKDDNKDEENDNSSDDDANSAYNREKITEVDTEAHVGSSKAEKTLIKGLGEARHSAVIASLYIVRADRSMVVRQAAIQVWKMVVYNTGRTMRIVLPALMDYVIQFLSSDDEDKRFTAGTALGDIVRKLGDRVLPRMVPILKDGLSADDEGQRQGVCRGLVELIAAAGRRNLQKYAEDLISAVKIALCDTSQEVRESAATAFNSLHKQVGQDVMNIIFPSLLRMLENGDEQALLGIKEVVAQKSGDLLPYLIPKLIKPVPLGKFQSTAIEAVATVSGSVLHNHVNVLLPAIIESVVHYGESNDSESKQMSQKALQGVVCSIEDVGVQWTCVELGKHVQNGNPKWRAVGFWTINEFLTNSTTDFSAQLPMLLKDIFNGFFDEDQTVLVAANTCLATVNKVVDVVELLGHLDFIRQTVSAQVSRLKYGTQGIQEEVLVPGYNIPKGLAPVVPVYLHGLMYGSTLQREYAAEGIGELVKWSSADSLKRYFVKLTGPLIRVVGDRFPSSVKGAILKTLILLLGKAGVKLRAFLPQLQTTFLKNIPDTNHIVRRLSVEALDALLPMITRVDPLVTEVLNGLIAAELTGVKESYATALANIIKVKKEKISEKLKDEIADFLRNKNENDDIEKIITSVFKN